MPDRTKQMSHDITSNFHQWAFQSLIALSTDQIEPRHEFPMPNMFRDMQQALDVH